MATPIEPDIIDRIHQQVEGIEHTSYTEWVNGSRALLSEAATTIARLRKIGDHAVELMTGIAGDAGRLRAQRDHAVFCTDPDCKHCNEMAVEIARDRAAGRSK